MLRPLANCRIIIIIKVGYNCKWHKRQCSDSNQEMTLNVSARTNLIKEEKNTHKYEEKSCTLTRRIKSSSRLSRLTSVGDWRHDEPSAQVIPFSGLARPYMWPNYPRLWNGIDIQLDRWTVVPTCDTVDWFHGFGHISVSCVHCFNIYASGLSTRCTFI